MRFGKGKPRPAQCRRDPTHPSSTNKASGSRALVPEPRPSTYAYVREPAAGPGHGEARRRTPCVPPRTDELGLDPSVPPRSRTARSPVRGGGHSMAGGCACVLGWRLASPGSYLCEWLTCPRRLGGVHRALPYPAAVRNPVPGETGPFARPALTCRIDSSAASAGCLTARRTTGGNGKPRRTWVTRSRDHMHAMQCNRRRACEQFR